MKELIYTGIFIALGLLLIILLIVVFSPKKSEEAASPTQEPTYVPGIYTTSLMLNDRTVDIAVTVDENNINDIRMVNLDEAVTTMFPLLEPAFDDLANQIVRNQSVSDMRLRPRWARQKPGCTKLNLRLRLAFTKCSTSIRQQYHLLLSFLFPVLSGFP